MQALEVEVTNVRQGEEPSLAEGDQVRYDFRLENNGGARATLTIPTRDEVQAGSEGPGEVTQVNYTVFSQDGTERASGETTEQNATIILEPEETVEVFALVTIGPISPLAVETVTVGLGNNCDGEEAAQSLTLISTLDPLTDPFGQITGCAGELLADYRGFTVTLFDPAANGIDLANVTNLVETEIPDIPNNIPLGIEPNEENANPFSLTNEDEGRYSFLFDESLGQLDIGRTYILVVNPPDDSIFVERRIEIRIDEVTEDNQGRPVVRYTATALDGTPISILDPLQRTVVQAEIILLVPDAERVGLNIGVGAIAMCEPVEIRIDKTGDRATAQPGDIVIYRLTVRNLTLVPLRNIEVTDILPQGFNFLENSVRSELLETTDVLESFSNDPPGTVTFNLGDTTELNTGDTLTIVYAAEVTPDAIRGTARNSASVIGERIDNGLTVRDGPVNHRLRLQPGILSDTGIIIGRVFVDKNFDGEQQRGEPGVPNAVIFLEDGNRITTDADGLFSVTNVLPGHHTGVLDLTSLPGYTLAPNIKFKARNSQSRLVRLAPGGLVKMNFGVTPTFREEEEILIEEEEQPSSPITEEEEEQASSPITEEEEE